MRISSNERSNVTTATVSKKGWVVIPREIRERYGVHPGDEVHIVDYAGGIAIIPTLNDPVQEGRGLIKSDLSLPQALVEERHREWQMEKAMSVEWLPDA